MECYFVLCGALDSSHIHLSCPVMPLASRITIILIFDIYPILNIYIELQEVNAADFEELGEMVSSGALKVEVGKHLHGLEELPDALAGHSATLGQGHSVGKTVVTFKSKEE